jgi:proton glutamate symport protein
MAAPHIGLAWKILIALVLGVIVGTVLHGVDSSIRDWAVVNVLKPAGQIFIALIKMIVLPIVVSSLIVGVAGIGDAKKLGNIGLKTIVYFEVVTTVAIVFGVVLANVFQPGAGLDMQGLAMADISSYKATTEASMSQSHGLVATILGLIPNNIFKALAGGEMLPVIFFSVMFGLGLAALPAEHRELLVAFFRSVSETMFNVTHMVMRYAPVGVFALIAVTVATFGFASMIPLAKLVLLIYAAIILFAVVVLGGVARWGGFKLFRLMRLIKDELVLAFSTASSETVLPRLMSKMERYGVSKSIASFVIPTGYSFNLDGSTLYQSIAAIFIAQLYGIELSLWQQLVIIVTLMITSKGMAGVTGASLVVLLATAASVGLPLEGVAFVAGVDRILDMARTALNVVGNAVATVLIAKWEGQYDADQGRRYEREQLGIAAEGAA